MTSIYEVADRASVSITTVSHVFSGRRPVAPETRDRVLEAANQLNYQPNHTAKGLATGRSMILGIYFPHQSEPIVQNPFFPELLEGLSTAAAKAGYAFLLIPEDEDANTDLLTRVDGVIIVDPLLNDPISETILAHGLPLVSTGRCLERPDTPWVDSDNIDGINQTFEHLDEQDYRRPLLLSTKHRCSYIEDIEAGYKDATKNRGMPTHIVSPDNLSESAAYQMIREVLSAKQPPDAIITATDHQAVAALRAARDLGILVPEELGVVGAGNTVLSYNVVPSLTSVGVQPRLLGEGAVEVVLALLDGAREDATNRLIAAGLVVRDSSRRTKIPGT
jgi:DNA-binding LacI/PurR family transcriptional regulator